MLWSVQNYLHGKYAIFHRMICSKHYKSIVYLHLVTAYYFSYAIFFDNGRGRLLWEPYQRFPARWIDVCCVRRKGQTAKAIADKSLISWVRIKIASLQRLILSPPPHFFYATSMDFWSGFVEPKLQFFLGWFLFKMFVKKVEKDYIYNNLFLIIKLPISFILSPYDVHT